MAHPYAPDSVAGVVAGLVVRGVIMIADRRRQFPTHPHGEVVHLFLGFVAATLGALAVPALLTGDFTAGVFLGLGTAQFHTVRGLESGALLHFDRGDAVPRGPVYAEGIALAFEARNFLIFGVAVVASGLSIAWGWPLGLLVAVGAGVTFLRLLQTETLGQIMEVASEDLPGSPEFGPEAPPGLRVRITPRSSRAAAILRSPAQRQAILHDLHAGLGAQLAGRDGSLHLPRAAYTPDGSLVVEVWPLIREADRARQVAVRIPVLEAIAGPLRVASR